MLNKNLIRLVVALFWLQIGQGLGAIVKGIFFFAASGLLRRIWSCLSFFITTNNHVDDGRLSRQLAFAIFEADVGPSLIQIDKRAARGVKHRLQPFQLSNPMSGTMPVDVQDFRPFDNLPNELVVKIFTLAIAVASPRETFSKLNGEKPPSRGLLSHVCRRWKDILRARVCIGVPQIYCLTLSKDTLESGYVFCLALLSF